jgi:hypothetical protein
MGIRSSGVSTNSPIMIEPGNWTAREWTFGRNAGLFSPILERLRGTPLRAEELVRMSAADSLAFRIGTRWSLQEHLGHLADLHDLDDRRLTEFLHRVETLSAADMSNSATEEAQHNALPIAAVLERLRTTRQILVQRLESLSLEEAQRASVHPRLAQRMTIVDWMFFVAEHDDHHLAHARIAALMASARGR